MIVIIARIARTVTTVRSIITAIVLIIIRHGLLVLTPGHIMHRIIISISF